MRPHPLTAGQPGKSTYELWLEAGNTGTLTDFFNYIGTLAAAGGKIIVNIPAVEGLPDALSNRPTFTQLSEGDNYNVIMDGGTF